MLTLFALVLVVVLLLRVVENLLDLVLVQTQRWLMHRRVPQQMTQLRAELEMQRSMIPEKIRASCKLTGCPEAETHIVEELARFDAQLPTLLEQTEKQFHQQAGELRVTSAWQLLAILGAPDVRVQQFRNIGALILPASRN